MKKPYYLRKPGTGNQQSRPKPALQTPHQGTTRLQASFETTPLARAAIGRAERNGRPAPEFEPHKLWDDSLRHLNKAQRKATQERAALAFENGLALRTRDSILAASDKWEARKSSYTRTKEEPLFNLPQPHKGQLELWKTLPATFDPNPKAKPRAHKEQLAAGKLPHGLEVRDQLKLIPETAFTKRHTSVSAQDLAAHYERAERKAGRTLTIGELLNLELERQKQWGKPNLVEALYNIQTDIARRGKVRIELGEKEQQEMKLLKPHAYSPSTKLALEAIEFRRKQGLIHKLIKPDDKNSAIHAIVNLIQELK
jgi:hypothetical protein